MGNIASIGGIREIARASIVQVYILISILDAFKLFIVARSAYDILI